MLAALVFLALFVYARNMRKKAFGKLANPSMLAKIALLPSDAGSWLKFSAFAASWVFACLALMGPRGNAQYSEAGVAFQNRFREDILFLIDTSQSMAVTDTTTGYSRLEYAKEIADQVVKRLLDHELMLITFTADAYLVSPLTDDTIFFRLRLKEIELDEGNTPPGTDFSKAFSELQTLYSFDPKEAYQTLLLFSDGEDLKLEDLAPEAKEQYVQRILSYISKQNFPHLNIDTIGMGSEKGGKVPGVSYQGHAVTSRLNPQLLQTIAEFRGGNYYLANDYSAEQLAGKIVNGIKNGEDRIKLSGSKENAFKIVYREYFQIPLFISILCFLLALFFPERLSSKLWLSVLIFFPISAISAIDDFDARQSYDAGDFPSAFTFYQKLYKEQPAPAVQYNLATVYLADKNFSEAIVLLKDLRLTAPASPLKLKASYNLALAYFKSAAEEKEPFWRIYFLQLALDALRKDPNSYAMNQAGLLYKKALTAAVNAYSHLPETKDILAELALYYQRGVQDAALSPFFLSSLAALQEKALKLFPNSEELKKAKEYLDESSEWLTKGNRLKARFFLLEALIETQKVLNPSPKTPKAKLSRLINFGEGSLDLKRLVLEGGDLNNELAKEVGTQAAAFPQAVIDWQKKRFAEGKCQCLPWRVAMPLFFQGYTLWNTAQSDAAFAALDLGEEAVQSWKKALDEIKNAPEGGAQETAQEEALRSLQEMQQMDRLPQGKTKLPKGEKKW